MATIDDVTQAIRNADAAGDTASVQALAPVLKQMVHAQNLAAMQAQTRKESDPSLGGGTLNFAGLDTGIPIPQGVNRFLAGTGKAFSDFGSGVKQIFTGNSNQQEIDDTKRLDAPLMATGAGVAGNVTGNVATVLPAAFIPGVNGLAGSAALGVVLGGIQPVASDESRLKNIAIGGAAGLAGPVVARGVTAAAQGVKALVEPFTAGGRQAIAGRTLQSFGVAPADVAGLSGAPTITGAVPTLAEQITRPEAAAGAARLQDSLASLDPTSGARMAAGATQNNAARVATLNDVAGSDGARDFAAANRSATGADMYKQAFQTPLDPSLLSPAQTKQLAGLMQRPAVQDAVAQAKEIAANQGIDIGDPTGSTQGLHLVKLALDDAANSAGPGAIGTNKALSIEAASKALVPLIETMNPEYKGARVAYAQMSKPVNQMDVAQTILDRSAPNTTDLAGNPTLSAAKMGNTLANEPQLIKSATGRPGVANSLSDLMEPDQLAKIGAVAKEVDRAAAVAKAGNGPGSGTAQRMASTNVLRQLLGPTGLPQSWAESALLGTAARPLQFGASIAEPKIQMTLADLILDPSKAAAAMQAATPTQRTALQKVLSNPDVKRIASQIAPAALASPQDR